MYPHIIIGSQQSDFDSYLDDFKKLYSTNQHSQYVIEPTEKKSITIDQIRELKKELVVKTMPRLIIIFGFHMATLEAQNALLKTLEEKTDNNQFLLFTQQIGTILPTIISRSIIEYASSKDKPEEVSSMHIHLLDSLLKQKNYSLMNDPLMQVSTADEAKDFFRKMLIVLQSQMREGHTVIAPLIKEALELHSLLDTNNLNPQLAVDSWFLKAKHANIKL